VVFRSWTGKRGGKLDHLQKPFLSGEKGLAKLEYLEAKENRPGAVSFAIKVNHCSRKERGMSLKKLTTTASCGEDRGRGGGGGADSLSSARGRSACLLLRKKGKREGKRELTKGFCSAKERKMIHSCILLLKERKMEKQGAEEGGGGDILKRTFYST